MITFVTGNSNKVQEFRQILGNRFQVAFQDLDLPELQGDPVEIAKEKCKLAAEKINGPAVTEDTSLCFNALNGLPGPYIKWFMKAIGTDGIVRLLHGFSDKTAYALCIFAYSEGPGSEPIVFEGRCDGTIVDARGPQKFGWNSIFEPQQSDKTFSEMTEAEKNAISHRSKALEKLCEHLNQLAHARQ